MINKKLNYFDNIIQEYGRTGVSYYTDNLDEAFELMSKGWRNNSTKGFKMTPLEETIVDITDYDKALQYNNLNLNLLYFEYLIKMYEKKELNKFVDKVLNKNKPFYNHFNYFISYGKVLETEIRIAGSDLRIKQLKKDLMQEFKIQIGFNSSYDKKNYRLLKQEHVDLCNRSIKEIAFFKDLEQKINIVRKTNVYNTKNYKINNWNIIENMRFDVYLFIPFGCFKYLSSFVSETNADKIMFWEIHGEKTKNSEFKLFSKNLKNKIDKIYSGKTLKLIKKKVKQLGGTPFILGINPKNKKNISQTDFVIILNHVFYSKKLKKEKNLFKNLYKNILYEEEHFDKRSISTK